MKKCLVLLLSSAFTFFSCGAVEVLAANKALAADSTLLASSINLNENLQSNTNDVINEDNVSEKDFVSVQLKKAETSKPQKAQDGWLVRTWNSLKGVVNIENGIKSAVALAIWLASVGLTFKAYDNAPESFTNFVSKTNDKLSQFYLFREGKYKFILAPIVNNQFVIAGLRDLLQFSGTYFYIPDSVKEKAQIYTDTVKNYTSSIVGSVKDSVNNLFSKNNTTLNTIEQLENVTLQ